MRDRHLHLCGRESRPEEVLLTLSETKQARLRTKTGYLPGLDGWRALAILGVIMNHDRVWFLARHSNARVRGFGGWGVYLFFAISGYLICTRILEEEKLSGRFNITGFYIRRVCRIQPAAITYLAVIAALISAGLLQDKWHGWIGALFLYTNYLYNASDGSTAGYFTGHFWTLAVEEHFYILLSLMLLFIKRRRIAVFGIFTALLLAAQRYGLTHGYFHEMYSGRHTFWLVQLLLFPAFLALLLQAEAWRLLCMRFLRPWVAYLGTAFVLMLWSTHDFGLLGALRGFRRPGMEASVFLYGFSFWVVATTLHPSSWTTRFLETRPLRMIGRLSYSIYLWHVLFFVPTYPEVGITWHPLLLASERPWKYILTLTTACISYYLIERPMMRYGHLLAPPATPGHKDLGVATS